MRRRLPRFYDRSSPNFLVLLLLVVLLALGVAAFFLFQGGKYGKAERFNLVLAAHPVTLVSLDEKLGKAVVVSFPDDLYVPEVVPSYGGYKISAVYKVGELDKRGGQVLSWTVSELLGVPIDGFLAEEGSVGSDIKFFFLNPKLFWGDKTDMNVLDWLRFVYGLSQVRFDKIDKVDLGKYAEPLLLADGTTVASIDKNQLDSTLSGEFLESGIRDENLRVEVVNSTPVAALGARVARLLTNIGMSVINVGSVQEETSGCRIETETKYTGFLTVKRIAQIYSCQVARRSGESRAEVTVVLGRDYAERFK